MGVACRLVYKAKGRSVCAAPLIFCLKNDYQAYLTPIFPPPPTKP